MTKKKKKLSKIDKFFDHLFGWGGKYKVQKGVLSPHLVLDFGWYQGNNFRVVSLILGDTLWDRKDGLCYFQFFDLSFMHFSFSLTLYPHDDFISPANRSI